MPTDAVPPDPWSAFLDWLTTVLVPDWGGLIELLPISSSSSSSAPSSRSWPWAGRGTSCGAGAAASSAARHKPSPVPRADDGTPLFPANAPYCEEHALVYPPRARRCAIDQAPLAVACPVDGTIRAAEIQTCAACGTRFTLGAGSSPLLVTSAGGPPEGGAAAA